MSNEAASTSLEEEKDCVCLQHSALFIYFSFQLYVLYVGVGAHTGQKRVSDPLVLELKPIIHLMWVLCKSSTHS